MTPEVSPHAFYVLQMDTCVQSVLRNRYLFKQLSCGNDLFAQGSAPPAWSRSHQTCRLEHHKSKVFCTSWFVYTQLPSPSVKTSLPVAIDGLKSTWLGSQAFCFLCRLQIAVVGSHCDHHMQLIPIVAAFIRRKGPQRKVDFCHQHLALAMPHFWAVQCTRLMRCASTLPQIPLLQTILSRDESRCLTY